MSARFGIGLLALGSAFAAFGVAMLPTACTVLTNNALPDDAGPFEGGDSGDGGSSCNACVTQQCLGERSVCLLDGTCTTTRTCVGAGGSLGTCACPSATSSGLDGGAAPFGAYVDDYLCGAVALETSTACADACKTERAAGSSGDPHQRPTELAACTPEAGAPGDVDGGDGGDAAPPPVAVTVEGCSGCISGNCGDPKKACALGTECAQFLDCASSCNAACVTACGTSFPGGKESARELSNCAVTACASACGL